MDIGSNSSIYFFMQIEVRRPDIYALVKQAVADGLQVVQRIEKEGKYIGRYYQFPKLDLFKSGFPHFLRHSFGEGPFEYDALFSYGRSRAGAIGASDSRVDCGKIGSWVEFGKLAEGDEFLKAYFSLGSMCKYPESILEEAHTRYYTFGTISRFVDRFVHLAKTTQFEESIFGNIYREWEASVFLDELPFSIYVPIICTKFDFDIGTLDERSTVARMCDDFHLARNVERDFNYGVHRVVIGAATHALVLDGWVVPNRTIEQSGEILTELGAFSSVIPLIENFFAALRAVCGVETGYAQFVIKPSGWSRSWQAHLPSVQIVSTRNYPDHFESHGWLRDPPAINLETLTQVSLVYRALKEAKNNRLAIAAKRLNAAYLRKDEADSILDVTIALEALLGDEAKTEMTHKLALRLAALSVIEPFKEEKPPEVFGFVKKIYAYRSAIVHGSKKSETKRTIALKNNEEIPVSSQQSRDPRLSEWFSEGNEGRLRKRI